MRIVIVGQGPFGEKVLERLLQKGEQVVGVFAPPDKRGEPLRKLAEKSGIPAFQPSLMKAPEVEDQFRSLRPDLAILAFVTDIVPERLLNVPSIGTICYHPSLLPRHRGASAINWAIIQGDTRTGLTIFWVDKGIDTGPILLQKEVEIGPEETTGSLYFNTLFPMGVDAIAEAVDLIKAGRAPKIPQDHSKATYEPPCDDRVAAIDFARPIGEVYNLIRGCDPQPGAYTAFRGKRIRLYEVKKRETPSKGSPGEVEAIGEKGLEIAVPGGTLLIGKLRIDKGEKIGPMEFAQSVGLKVGDRLGE
ncbi:MAG: methionyl-tRNA formyltransferase [Desulfobacterota bacterium]|nr:methionyl-tRNA formyltransferase [Thermodesulfobacteriota bacterium]